MTTGTTAEAEAALTDAQRAAVLRLDREWRFLGLASRPDKCHPVIERWNRPNRGFNYRLTPLGLAVREAFIHGGEHG